MAQLPCFTACFPSISHSRETCKTWSYLYYRAGPFVSGSKFVDTCRIQLKVLFALYGDAPQTSLHVPQTSLFFAPSLVMVLVSPGPLFPQSQSISTFPELSPPPDPSLVGRTTDWGALIKSRVGLFNLGCYFWLHKFRYAEG